MNPRRFVLAVLALALSTAACGAYQPARTRTTPQAIEEPAQTTRSSGCTACHMN